MGYIGSILLSAALLQGALSASLTYVHVPSSVRLPASADLKLTDVQHVTAQLLGLSTKAPNGWTGGGDLLSRPRAALSIAITGPSHILPKIGQHVAEYSLTADSPALSLGAVVDRLPNNEKALTVESAAKGLEGAQGAYDKQATFELKTKAAPLRQELESVHRLINWLDDGGARLRSTSNSPDLFTVRITGLTAALAAVGGRTDDADYVTAVDETKTAIEGLSNAIRRAYGDQAIVQVVNVRSEAEAGDTAEQHLVFKRRADNEAAATPAPPSAAQLMLSRYYYSAVGMNYPAAFAIIAGVSLVLAIAVLVVAVGMWHLDPGTESILYRMTTTRMKRD